MSKWIADEMESGKNVGGVGSELILYVIIVERSCKFECCIFAVSIEVTTSSV